MTSIAVLIFGIGYWSLFTRISGAVVASGTVKVETERQVAQHPDGGVVSAILARDGDSVEAGDVLVKLDGTFLRSELQVVERQLMEILVRRFRLEAERDQLSNLQDIALGEFSTLDNEWMTSQLEGQRNLFNAKLASHKSEIDQLKQQSFQIEDQVRGMEAQVSALKDQLDLVETEIKDLEALLEQGLVQASRVLALRREQARLKGEIGQLEAAKAEAKGRQTGVSIEIINLENRRREGAITELRDLRFSEIPLVENRQSLKKRLSRLEVRSPSEGVVFGSSVFAEQAVIKPADPIMYIVPKDRPLQVSARIDPVHIDQVYEGQPVSLRFTTFDQRTTPEVLGVVVRISADTFTDDAQEVPYYEAVLQPDTKSLTATGDVLLVPGMPVEAFIKTDARAPISYLVQPLANYFRRALRES
ncbi:HlyD family type I secretion periplasmic adaptor subunit [Ruegeria sp. HU-ET01832]|uniref:HlyD family type I secretion periplasmic adaptor subunit n=1 Tax=Ruegeria sp. HU-ET01832 TaxID=3135906 RepID=UPI0033421740